MLNNTTARWLLVAGLSWQLLCQSVSANQVELHDPVMAKEGDTYYVFSTGPGITF